MTREEIFTSLLNHMVKGLMVHDQMANYYDFLGLEEYKDCHEKHYLISCSVQLKLDSLTYMQNRNSL